MITRKRLLLPFVLTWAAIAVTGCASADSSNNDLPPLPIERLVAQTTPFQREIISDGIVEPAEYEKALLTRRNCVAAAGATPSALYTIGNNETTFDFTIEATSENAVAEIQDRADACIPMYFSEVGAIWAYQQILSPQQRREQQPSVISCLRDVGISVAIDADLESIRGELDNTQDGYVKAQPCFERYPAYFSVPNSFEPHDH